MQTDLDDVDVKLLDDSHHSERTVFVTPSEPVGLPPNVSYTYHQFGTLNPVLMVRTSEDSLLDPPIVGGRTKTKRSNSENVCGSTLHSPSSPLARRTKHKIKNLQKFAPKKVCRNSNALGKMPTTLATLQVNVKATSNQMFHLIIFYLLSSIGFLHRPRHVMAPSWKVATLRSAYAIWAMQKLRVLPADEVCYLE